MARRGKNLDHMGSNLGGNEGGFAAVKGKQAKSLIDEKNPKQGTSKGTQGKAVTKLTQNPVFPTDERQSIG